MENGLSLGQANFGDTTSPEERARLEQGIRPDVDKEREYQWRMDLHRRERESGDGRSTEHSKKIAPGWENVSNDMAHYNELLRNTNPSPEEIAEMKRLEVDIKSATTKLLEPLTFGKPQASNRTERILSGERVLSDELPEIVPNTDSKVNAALAEWHTNFSKVQEEVIDLEARRQSLTPQEANRLDLLYSALGPVAKHYRAHSVLDGHMRLLQREMANGELSHEDQEKLRVLGESLEAIALEKDDE